MRLEKEGKSTSAMWMVGGAVGALVLAGGAAMIAGGGPPPPAPEPVATPAPAPTPAAKPTAAAPAATKPAAATPAGAKPAAKPADAAKPAAAAGGKVKMIKGMKVEDLKVGTGAEAVDGKHVFVDYKGTLTDGTVFDESYSRGQQFDFDLPGQVIEGWNLGVVGMKEGGKRRLTIPGDLAYGAMGSPPKIGPNATLIFEIELHKVS